MSAFNKSAVLAALFVMSLSSAASAHIGGHAGGFTNGLAHPFYGLDHVLAMVAVGIWASQLGRPALWLLPLTFPVVMAAGFAMGVGGIALPWVEIAVALSVLVLGLAIALALRPSIVASMALIGVFALFHGHVHGTELPAHGSALSYGAGFMLATVILHGIGLGLGLGIGTLPRRPALTRAAGGAIAAAGLLLLVVR